MYAHISNINLLLAFYYVGRPKREKEDLKAYLLWACNVDNLQAYEPKEGKAHLSMDTFNPILTRNFGLRPHQILRVQA